jgi:hypothetical protein
MGVEAKAARTSASSANSASTSGGWTLEAA